jgi:hypothetical protein
MSGMHIVGPYLTTNKSKVRGKRAANTAAARAAAAKHDGWLRKQGLHPDQRALASAFKGKRKIEFPDLKVEENAPLSNKIDGNGLARGMMVNLQKESAAVQKEIMDKAARTTMAYNKGPIQYFSPEADTTNIGTQSRRG